jgi:outer membrane protein
MDSSFFGVMNMQLRSRWLPALALLALAPQANAANLLDVFQQAQRNDPLIREAQATRMATQEAKPQARSQLLPQVSISGSFQETDGDATQNDASIQRIFTGAVDVDSDSERTTYGINLTQSIFRWDRWVALKRADKVSLQADLDYRAAEQDLAARVSTRYFDVLAAQDTLDASQGTLEALSRQLEQAEKRFEVGLTAVTDVREARAARDQATATVIANKRALATSKEFLREVTGEFYEVLSTPNDDLPLKAPEPANADRWVTSALEQNPRLASARLGAEITRRDIELARADSYPSLDLVFGRQTSNSDGDEVRQVNGATISQGPTQSDQEGNTVSLQLQMPLFTGGGINSRVRQRVYLHRASRERLERTVRETERATRDAYLGVISGISRVEALKQAVESSQTALQATEAGFDVGTRTTVDVLDARRRLLDAQTAFFRSRYDYILSVIQLKQASGSLSADDVKQINTWLK